jgi:hypothetical protein
MNISNVFGIGGASDGFFTDASKVNGDFAVTLAKGQQTVWQSKGVTWWGSRANDTHALPAQWRQKALVGMGYTGLTGTGKHPYTGKKPQVKLSLEERFPGRVLAEPCKSGDLQALDLALAGAPPAALNGEVDSDGQSPLGLAARGGHVRLVQRLLAAGSLPDRADRDGKTPCFWAAHQNRPEVIGALVAAGADVRPACSFDIGSVDDPPSLRHREQVNIMDSNGLTPLSHTVSCKWVPVRDPPSPPPPAARQCRLASLCQACTAHR